MVQRAALAVAPDAGEIDDASLAGRQQLLGCEFRRGPQVPPVLDHVRPDQAGRKGMQMGLVARGDLKGGGLDLEEAGRCKPAPERGHDPAPGQKVGPAGRMPPGEPELSGISGHLPRPAPGPERLEMDGKIAMVRPESGPVRRDRLIFKDRTREGHRQPSS